MRAARLFGPRDLRVIDTEKPLSEPDSVIVEVACCVLCGSDVFQWDGRIPPASYPAGFGHESAGTIVEVGSEVRGLAVGDRVTWYVVHGSLQEYFAFRPEDMAVGKVAPHLTCEEGANVQLVCAVLRGVANGEPAPGKRALVLGCGAVGLSALQGALAMGCDEIVAADLIPFRRDMACRLGASYLVDPGEDGWFQALSKAGERFDIIYDCMDEDRSPNGDTLDLALHLLKPRSPYVALSLSAIPRRLRLATIVNTGMRIVGAHHSDVFQAREFMALACQWVGDGTIDVSSYVTHRFPLERCQEAVEAASSHADGVLKVAVGIGEP
jgi:L-iditol 2-dehydrogenase